MFVGNVKGAAILALTATYSISVMSLPASHATLAINFPKHNLSVLLSWFCLVLYNLRNYYKSSFFELSVKFKFMANHLFTLRQLITCKREISPRSIVENVM